jgi:hypothetical protein
MDSSPRARRPSDAPSGFSQPERVSVYQLYRQQMQCLAGLPGQVSEFHQSEFGYEWRCEFDLDDSQSLQLQFSLVDLERQPRPAAVLSLLGPGRDARDRWPLPVEDLNETHELLNDELNRRGASIHALQSAHRFMTALMEVREVLGDADVTWA